MIYLIHGETEAENPAIPLAASQPLLHVGIAWDQGDLKNTDERASLVAQWLRICLPMQGTRVRALVWEDPTCRGATKPVRHNY